MKKTLLKFFARPNLFVPILIILAVGAMYLLLASGDRNENADENQNDQSAQNKNLKNQGNQNFTHPDFGFSFEYPAGYTLTTIEEGEAENILVQKKGSGLQIYVSAYDGPSVNASLVKKEITDVKVENLNDIEMRSGFKAVAFSYVDPSLGEVWNVWFSYKPSALGGAERLYQITAQAGNDEALKLLVETLRFE